jgi:phage-related protein
MAEERTITTVFKADISNFSASTQQLNKYVAQVNSEFKNATASMGRWNDNADGLRAKLEQLNKVHDAEAKKLKILEDEYAEVIRTKGATSKEAQKLATAINNQSAVVKETKKNIEYYSGSLKELEDAGVDTRAELDKLNKELEESKQEAKELGSGVLRDAATGIAGIGVACVGAFAAVNGIVESSKELRTQIGMLETAFTNQGHSVADAEKTYNELFSVLGDSGKATEAAQHLAQVAKSEEELASYTNILTGVYAAFGDSLPVESLAEAISVSSTLGEVNGTLADALEFSGYNVDSFNEQLAALNTEEERAQLINKTLNDIYGESATKYKEVNADVIAANEAQNQYNQAMADLGEKAQPIITEFKMIMVEALGWILDNKDLVIAGVAGIGAAFVAWKVTSIVQGAVGAVKALSAATKGQTIAQTALNLVMKANPLGIIITAVAGLTAAFVVLWNKCEGFRNFWKGFINTITGGFNVLLKGLNKISFDIPDWVPVIGGGKFGFNIPLIPKLAEGGIVDRATLAMIGEAGKEAVVPLERTQWIDKLAEKINASGRAESKTFYITNNFERMETSRHALHKANLETKRLLREA